MFIRKLEIDIEQFKVYLSNSINSTYRELIQQLKKYITVSTIISILDISLSTHNRYLNDKDVSPSILIHLDLLLKTYKELNNE